MGIHSRHALQPGSLTTKRLSTGVGRGRCSTWVWALAYLFFAFWSYRHCLFTGALPASRPANGVVTLFNVWTIWWNADRVSCCFQNYWDAPIFWPEKGAFAFSEPQPLTAAVAPVVWMFDPVAAYHVYFVGSLVLNGVVARRLIHRWTQDHWIAGYAGALVVWLPLILQQPELIQYAPLWPVLWQWDVVLRMLDRPIWTQALELGFAWALTFATSIQLGLFAALILVLIVPWFFMSKKGEGVGVWMGGIGLGTLLILAVGLPMSRILSPHAVVRPPEVVTSLSARVGEWLTPPPHGLDFYLGACHGIGGRCLNPGWLVSFLAVGITAAAICRRLQESPLRRMVLFLAAIAVVSVIGSLGPKIRVGQVSIWDLLARVIPPFAAVRSPYRFAYLAQLTILLLSALGLMGVRTYFQKILPGVRKGVLSGGIFGVLGLVCLLEVLPGAPFLVVPPDYSRPPGWARYLAGRAPANTVVLVLDFPVPGQLIEYEPTVRVMLWQPVHRCWLVNGYSGVFPAGWWRLAEMWRKKPYSEEVCQFLKENEVRFLLRPPTFPAPPRHLPHGLTATRLFVDKTGWEVWKVE